MVPEIFAFLGTDTARPDFEITTFKYEKMCVISWMAFSDSLYEKHYNYILDFILLSCERTCLEKRNLHTSIRSVVTFIVVFHGTLFNVNSASNSGVFSAMFASGGDHLINVTHIVHPALTASMHRLRAQADHDFNFDAQACGRHLGIAGIWPCHPDEGSRA